MAALSRTLGFLQQNAMYRLLPITCHLHTSPSQCNSNKSSVARIRRQTYSRSYPVLLVKPDGSAFHIRYKEPKWILTGHKIDATASVPEPEKPEPAMPIDPNTLSEAERRERLWKRNAQKAKLTQEEVFDDEFNLDEYRKFWKK